jgi:integrase
MPKKRGNNEGSISQRKDGRFMARITIGRDPTTGKLKRVCFYGKTRKAVADQMARALGDLGRGAFVAPHKLTLGAWLETWLKDYKAPSIRPITLDSYAMMIRYHLKPALGHIALKDLRPEQVQRVYDDKRDAGLSPRTVRYIHTILHSALKQAMKNQLVLRNVSEATTRPTGKPRRMHPLTLPQVNQLLTAVKDDRAFPAIFLALGTGVRRGELLGLRWVDMDLDAGVLHVRQALIRVGNHDATAGDRKGRLIFQEPKTEESRRTTPVPADITEALKHHKARQAQEKLLFGEAYDDHGLVFCQPNGQPIDPRTFTRYFERLLHQAGVPRIRFHDGRHTFATLMLELGEAPKTVQTMLGHTKIATTLDVYSHVSLDLETRAAARLNAALRGEYDPLGPLQITSLEGGFWRGLVSGWCQTYKIGLGIRALIS